MDVSDSELLCNRDWDPSYLHSIFSNDFDECLDLWANSINDMDLVKHVESVEKYCLIVEDISIDDETLCKAVEGIEKE